MGRRDDFADRLRHQIERARTSLHERFGDDADLFEHLPDLFLAIDRLLRDRSVSDPVKRALEGAAGYILLPTDLLPERKLGAPGYVDDLWVAVLAVQRADPRAAARAWRGGGELREILARAKKTVPRWLGADMDRRLRSLF